MRDKARRVTRTDCSGRIEVLADRFEGKRFNAPNDIIVRRDGHVFFTDPLFTPLDQREIDFYGVYHITPTGQIDALARMTTRPNGIALSPDGRTLYVANTDERNVRAYDVDANGKASNERVLATLDCRSGRHPRRRQGQHLRRRPWRQIIRLPVTLLGNIAAPVSPRNLAFGDEDLKTLYLVGNSIFKVRLDTPDRFNARAFYIVYCRHCRFQNQGSYNYTAYFSIL